MPSERTLTIAIPTYNRAASLDGQLGRLSAQVDASVEVLVSDNASGDNTAEVVKKYQGKIPGLVYSRNAENVGFDRNIIKLYSVASGRHIWFLSDDDPILSGALEKVRPLISAYDPTVAVLGAAASPDDAAGWRGGRERVEVFGGLGEVPDYSFFTRAIFLSGLLVRKDPGVDAQLLEGYAGSNFVQLSLALILLSRRFKFCLAQDLSAVCREPGYVTRVEIAGLWFCGPAGAMALPGYGYDPVKTRNCTGRLWPFAQFLLAAKLGMYRMNPAMGPDTARRFRALLGYRRLLSVKAMLALYRAAPAWPFKGLYWVFCALKYGPGSGTEMFKRKTRQALSTKASGF